MKQFNITMDLEQLTLCYKSLELFSRLQRGQISEISNPYIIPLPNAEYNDLEKKLLEIKEIMFPELKTKEIFALNSPQLSNDVKKTIDMIGVLIQTIQPNKQKQKQKQISNENNLITIKEVK